MLINSVNTKHHPDISLEKHAGINIQEVNQNEQYQGRCHHGRHRHRGRGGNLNPCKTISDNVIITLTDNRKKMYHPKSKYSNCITDVYTYDKSNKSIKNIPIVTGATTYNCTSFWNTFTWVLD